MEALKELRRPCACIMINWFALVSRRKLTLKSVAVHYESLSSRKDETLHDELCMFLVPIAGSELMRMETSRRDTRMVTKVQFSS